MKLRLLEKVFFFVHVEQIVALSGPGTSRICIIERSLLALALRPAGYFKKCALLQIEFWDYFL